jgi:hypothetical protein
LLIYCHVTFVVYLRRDIELLVRRSYAQFILRHLQGLFMFKSRENHEKTHDFPQSQDKAEMFM